MIQSEKVWDEFRELPAEAQQEVVDFVALLRQRYQTAEAKRRTKKTDLSKEPFVGMWRDRADMQDSTEWVRDLRKREGTVGERKMSSIAEIQYVSDEEGKPIGVIVPIALWREIASERETAYLLRSETMKRRLLEAKDRTNGISLEDAREKLGI